MDRFLSKVNKDTANGCWEWTAGKQQGYGVFSLGIGQMVKAHRWLYEQVNGAVPRELTLDHLCRNRACVNPAHLEPCTAVENIRRGVVARLKQSAQNSGGAS